jgi:hypothetical protein
MNRNNLEKIFKASYQGENKAEATLGKFGYTLDKNLSGKEQKVFVDEQGNPNIAFRGSKTAKDWLISDPLLAVGLETLDPRFSKAVKLTNKVADKYGKPVNLFGHSLGGKIAEYAGEKSNQEGLIYTMNKAVGLNDIGKKIQSNQIDIRTNNDPVSILSLTQQYADDDNQITLQSNTLNPIKAHSYTQL